MSQAKGTPLRSATTPVEVVASAVAWDDMTLRHSPDVDAIVIDLTPAEYTIEQTVALDAPSDAFLNVDAAGKAARVEFLDASSVFACHFYDHLDDVDGRGAHDNGIPLDGAFCDGACRHLYLTTTNSIVSWTWRSSRSASRLRKSTASSARLEVERRALLAEPRRRPPDGVWTFFCWCC
ncbi:hypothetical protein pqer_cds_993 [Pandoravirus quercus]|uniref:Uncharacterized protein n=2 Tax=Pandoravirus TaxID=2060084 RepID=A0A2U7UAK6_9VIRU|nr:hypothetical protein pqer_cds_993 [Pandoravirus quercus]AVK75415.1 hypothetical protein pqer_cds_993 [Pandoravirus quercus]QBZ81595.1 hypothetical protein pclt_cds_1009 [Pandoravirus celtis]